MPHIPPFELEANRYLDDQHYDQDQDGRVFGSDLSRISISTGENLSLAEGDALVAEWDQNGDGWLTRMSMLAPFQCPPMGTAS